MNPSRAAVAPALSIAVPGDWIIVDVDLTQNPALVEEIIDRRVHQEVITRRARDAAVELVTRVARDAAEAGVRFAAVLVTEDGGGTVVASLTVTSIWLDESDADADGSEAVHDTPAAVQRTDGADTGGTARPSRTEEVVLNAGPAVRLERVVALPVSDSLDQQVYSVDYVVPVDQSGATVVVSGTSPAIRRKDDLDAIFAEIANTLDIERSSG